MYNNNPKKYFPNLSAEEAYYYTKLIERVYKSKIRKKFAEANNIELSVRGQTNNRVLLQVQTAKADYRDAKFSKLTHSDIDMIVEMQEMFAELNDVAMPNTVRSASFFPTFISANHVNALKQLVGYTNYKKMIIKIHLVERLNTILKLLHLIVQKL